MGIKNRAGLVSAYFSQSRDFKIPLSQVIRRGLFQKTCQRIGPEYVRSIEDCGLLEKICLRGLSDPLFWPKGLPHYELYKSCGDCLSATHWHHYEVAETTVQPGETVVDCGAAEGMFGLSVLSRAAKLALFEPWEGFHAALSATFEGRAIIKPEALGKFPRTAFLSGMSLYGSVSDIGGASISVTTLDMFRREFGAVNFIKADVEGSEHDLLEGAKETILADRPKIAITAYHIGNDWETMLKIVRSVVPGYRFRIKGLSYNGRKARPVMLHLWI